MHQLAQGHATESIAVLEAQQAVVLPVTAAMRANGYDLGAKAIRALAEFELGHQAVATKLVDEIATQRPYAASVQALAQSLRLKFDSSLDAQLAEDRRSAPVSPSSAINGLLIAMESGLDAEAAGFGAGLTIDLPKMQVIGKYQAWRMRAMT